MVRHCVDEKAVPCASDDSLDERRPLVTAESGVDLGMPLRVDADTHDAVPNVRREYAIWCIGLTLQTSSPRAHLDREALSSKTAVADDFGENANAVAVLDCIQDESDAVEDPWGQTTTDATSHGWAHFGN